MRQPRIRYRIPVARTKPKAERSSLTTSFVKASEMPDSTIKRENIWAKQRIINIMAVKEMDSLKMTDNVFRDLREKRLTDK
jgi:hypothetical protein